MPDIYLHLNGQQSGPYLPEQVRQFVAEGKASAETPAWKQGLSEWSTIAAILGPLPISAPPPFVPPTTPPPVMAKKGMSGWLIAAIVVGCCVLLVGPCACLAGVALGPITNGIKKAKESAAMIQARAITLAMFAYANDHNGNYPDGKTSTEVFQKLIDGGYLPNPAMFYIAGFPGKTATTGQLTAANVCFDVTSGVTADSPDTVPLVFSTGYTVTYSPGAIPVRDEDVPMPFPGMVVVYKSKMAQILDAPSASYTVMRPLSQFIPATFDAGTKTYQQLKP